MLSNITTSGEFGGVSQYFMGHQNKRLSLGKRLFVLYRKRHDCHFRKI